MNCARRRQRGFTLVEIMVVAGLLATVGVFILELLSRGTDMWELGTMQTDLRTEGHRIVDRVTTELRNGTRAVGATPPDLIILAAPNNDRITFYLPADQDGNGLVTDAIGNVEWGVANPIQYQYVVAQQQVVRIEGAVQQVVAHNVTSVTFDDQSTDSTLYTNEVRVRLVLQRTTPHGRIIASTTTAIEKLRN